MNLPVVDANNDVLFGIKSMTQYIAGKNLLIHKSCEKLIEQCQSYAWDPVYANKGEDRPIKKNDHCVDSVRYLLASCFKHGLNGMVDQNMTVEQLRAKIYENDDFYSKFNSEVGIHF